MALISHAVTKGLNPDVEMKESGISWFKQIPKSWDVKQLKFVITKIQTGLLLLVLCLNIIVMMILFGMDPLILQMKIIF